MSIKEENIKKIIYHELNLQGYSISALSGGDTNTVYKVTGDNKAFVLKLEAKPLEQSRLKPEKEGLELLGKHTKVPTPIAFGFLEELTYLILPYINGKASTNQDDRNLGIALAKLHQVTHHQFGLEADNYIGSLPQYNGWDDNWSHFYWEKRLLPQLELAIQKGLLQPQEILPKETITKLLGGLHVKPSLLHGDLWNGNYLISKEAIPYFIDPAVYYGHHEVDIAMTLLFGGFGNDFYSAYFKLIPKQAGFEKRMHLYQLYYLLVHLNIFGASYYHSVKEKLRLVQ